MAEDDQNFLCPTGPTRPTSPTRPSALSAQLRVLIFHPALAPYRIDLLNHLALEMELRVVFMRGDVVYHRQLDQKDLRVQLNCLHENWNKGFRFMKRDFRIGMGRLIREWRPDVVCASEFSYSTLYFALYRRLRAPMDFGQMLWTEENPDMLARRGFIRRALRALCGRMVDSVVVYSQGSAEAFARAGLVEKEKLFVCGNHQSEDSFSAKLAAARSLISESLDGFHLRGKKVMLFVGRLAPEKNTGRLLEAFAQTHRQRPEAVLALVGDGPEKRRLEQQAAELGLEGAVIFAGHCDGARLHVWYLMAGAFILPSEYEPYGAVVNEALLAGLPVLCSSRVGARGLVREGVNGHIFDPLDVGAMQSAMSGILDSSPSAETAAGLDRKSLMPYPFKDDVAGFVSAARHAAKQRHLREERKAVL
ncbi:MAG: glycosyltransferase [Candidatus Sumerlaeota bacterium]|nr:glycosyltransferase [Candidatus Sumerlaeota bacterium]